MGTNLGSFVVSKFRILVNDPGYLFSSVWFELQKRLDRRGIRKIKRADLVIVDGIFPYEASLFRFREFNSYYNLFKDVRVYTTGFSLSLLSGHDDMRSVIRDYRKKYPGRKVAMFNPHQGVRARLAYCLFLENTYCLLDYFANNQLPFAFCLYPGGGFSLTDPESEMMLRAIVASPWFTRMIVTQKVTKNYLLDKEICTEDRIQFIYGVVSSGVDERFPIGERAYFGHGKDILDICFVANRYTVKGVDKGFDLFEEAAGRLLEAGLRVRFHVVGTFTEGDVSDPRCAGKIKFYGTLKMAELKTFFDGMDIILSPNRINTLLAGAFDGFPTASVTEAGLRGVLMMPSDELGQNICYADGEELVIVKNDADDLTCHLRALYDDPATLRRIALQGYKRTSEIYSDEYQIGKRRAFLEPLINRNSHPL